MQKNSLNRVTIVGRIGAKPEGRYTQQGRSFVSFSVATNETWKDSGAGVVDHTEWHGLVAWDKLADFAIQYLFRGQLVSCEGVLRTRSWKDKENFSHKTTEIICSSIVPLEWKKNQK